MFIKEPKQVPRQNEIEGSGATKDIATSESRRQSQAQSAPDTGYGSPREGRKLPKSLEQQALEQRRVQQLRQQQHQILVQQQQRQARTFRGHAGQPRFQNRKGQAQGQAQGSRGSRRTFQQGQFNQG